MMNNYRTAEGETLNIKDKEVRDFLSSNYPAVMANRPVGMSESYQFMPTWKLAETLQEGFGVGIVSVGQQFSRKRDPAGQEHFVKFRLPSDNFSLKVNDSVPELVLFNSHNGRSTIRAYAGVFRMVCANGMVVCEESFGSLKLRHFGEGNSYSAFEELLKDLGQKFKTLDDRIKAMSETILTVGQQQQLARFMMARRGTPNWVEPNMVLVGRRPEDQAIDGDGRRSLWITFNVIQENLTNSDEVSWSPESGRTRSLRRLTGARADILKNEAIWGGMETFIAKRFPDMAAVPLAEEAEEGDQGADKDDQELAPVSPADEAEAEVNDDQVATVATEESDEPADAPAEPVVAEGHAQEDGGQEDGFLRRENELAGMNQADLRKACKDNEIKGYGNMKKAEMINAIMAAEFGDK